MVLVLLGVIALIGGLIFKFPDFYEYFTDRYMGEKRCIRFENIGWIISMVSVFLLILCIGIITVNHVGQNAELNERAETYKALEYKVSSPTYRDENGYITQSLADEIQEWNEDIAYRKAIQRNTWVGVFVPNIYDGFRTIDYK